MKMKRGIIILLFVVVLFILFVVCLGILEKIVVKEEKVKLIE